MGTSGLSPEQVTVTWLTGAQCFHLCSLFYCLFCMLWHLPKNVLNNLETSGLGSGKGSGASFSEFQVCTDVLAPTIRVPRLPRVPQESGRAQGWESVC